MKTPYKTISFPVNTLGAMKTKLGIKSLGAVMVAVYDYFTSDTESQPDFSKYTRPELMTKFYDNTIKFIKAGIEFSTNKNVEVNENL